VATNQLADKGNCVGLLPDYECTLIQEYNNDGTRNLTINLMLESDPAAMQGLDEIEISVSRYLRGIRVPANQFVSNTYMAKCIPLIFMHRCYVEKYF